jgi:hypothetical protein
MSYTIEQKQIRQQEKFNDKKELKKLLKAGWRWAKGYNNKLRKHYLISPNNQGLYALGRYSDSGHYLKSKYPSRKNKDKDGYIKYIIKINKETIFAREHIIVARTFLGKCPSNMEVRHKNGDKVDNSKNNLNYGSDKRNMKDQIIHGTRIRGEKVALSKLKELDVLNIRKFHFRGVSIKKLAELYHITSCNIYYIVTGYTWRQVGGPCTRIWLSRQYRNIIKRKLKRKSNNNYMIRLTHLYKCPLIEITKIKQRLGI